MKKFPPLSPKVPQLLHGADYNPDQWLRYPQVLEEDLRLMELAGVNCVSLGIFSWAALEPREGQYNFQWMDHVIDSLYEHGVYTILATPSGARPAWMDEKYPEVRRVESNRVRNLHGLRHNHCNTSPKYRELVTQMNTMLARRYGGHPGVIMWHLSNEYGGECHCELCQESFRGWLRERYHDDIEELNEAWWTGFWSHRFASFEEVESPAPHGEPAIHGLNLDWKRFTTWKCGEFIKLEAEPLKKYAPDLPVTTNFMGTYTGLNYRELTQSLDRVSWDNYPYWHNPGAKDWEVASDIAFVHDLNRTLGGGRPFLLMESTPSMVNWHEVNRPKRPGMHLLSSLQAVAHGSDSVQYFQWRKSRGASEKFHGAVVDHCGHEHTRVFRDVQEVGAALKKLRCVAGASVPAQAAVLYDWENRWAIDDLQGWSSRRDYEETCKLHYRALWKRGIPTDIVGEDGDFSPYKLLIAPMLYMLRPGVARRIRDFVEAGGVFVATYCSGQVNETDLCFLGGFPGEDLRQVLGIWAEELDSLYPEQKNGMCFETLLEGQYEVRDFCELIHAEEAQVLARYTEDFYAGSPAATVNNFGAGRAYYLAGRTGFDLLDDFYGAVTRDLGLAPALDAPLPLGVSAAVREGDGEKYRFVLNFTPETQTVSLPREYEELLSGAFVSYLQLKPYGCAVLRDIL